MFDRVLSIPQVLNMLWLEYTWDVNIARLHRVPCKLCFKDSWYLGILNVLGSEYAKVFNVSRV